MDSSVPALKPPAMWRRATLAMEVSRISMKVASVTVRAMIHGLKRGFQCGDRDVRRQS